MQDLISRQAAIEAVESITTSMSVCINKDECHGMKRMQQQAVIELANLPSAQPERKRGKWVHDGRDFQHGCDWIHCSVCGKRGINAPTDLTNFCPNCGSYNGGGDDEADRR